MQDASMQKHLTHLSPKVWSIYLLDKNKNSFLKFHKEKPGHLNVMLIKCSTHIRTRKQQTILRGNWKAKWQVLFISSPSCVSFVLMKYFVWIKHNSVNVVFLPRKCSSVNCYKYATFQKRGVMRIKFFSIIKSVQITLKAYLMEKSYFLHAKI